MPGLRSSRSTARPSHRGTASVRGSRAVMPRITRARATATGASWFLPAWPRQLCDAARVLVAPVHAAGRLRRTAAANPRPSRTAPIGESWPPAEQPAPSWKPRQHTPPPMPSSREPNPLGHWPGLHASTQYWLPSSLAHTHDAQSVAAVQTSPIVRSWDGAFDPRRAWTPSRASWVTFTTSIASSIEQRREIAAPGRWRAACWRSGS